MKRFLPARSAGRWRAKRDGGVMGPTKNLT